MNESSLNVWLEVVKFQDLSRDDQIKVAIMFRELSESLLASILVNIGIIP